MKKQTTINPLLITLIVIDLIGLILFVKFGLIYSFAILIILINFYLIIRLFYRYGHEHPTRLNTILRIASVSALIIFIISFISIQMTIVSAMNYSDTRTDYDYIIILGGGLNGNKVSLVLKERLDKGIEMYKINEKATIIVSGGQGSSEQISEAKAMKNYLVDNGIDKHIIIMEANSTSTAENFEYSKEVLDSLGGADKKILVITSDFHLYRSLMLAQRKGLVVSGVASHTPFPEYLNSHSREYFALIKSYLFD